MMLKSRQNITMSDKKPLVSIIVPNYNHAAYLEKRLDSIFIQTFDDYEVIVLDDASTDNSCNVIARYQDSAKLKTIVNDVNSGNTFKQWNLGVNNAGGDYVWVAESDDFANPELLDTLVKVLNDNQNVGIGYCQSYYVDENDEILGSHLNDLLKLDQTLWRRPFILSGKYLLEKYMVSLNVIPNASAVIFRKDIFQGIGGAVENMQLCGDWMTWSKILLNTDVAFVSKPMNYFRIHNSTVRKRIHYKTIYLIEYLQVVKFIFENVIVNGQVRNESLRQILKRWIRICLNQSGKIDRAEFSKIFNDVKDIFGYGHAFLFIFIGTILPILKSVRSNKNRK